ncbi:MAG: aminopeptidase [Bacteroidia bacterium]|nr:aminopeptidase [Bacteroidia bacterium]
MKGKRSIVFVFALMSMTGFAQIDKLPDGFTVLDQCESTVIKSQDRTGTCWSFSTSSFLESEIIRTYGTHIDLSEMFTVRNIYMEKAMKYVRYQGMANFSQGSLAHDVLYSYQKYGMMPESAYSGKNGKKKHDHSAMAKELKSFLDSMIKTHHIDPHWKQSFTNILDKHMGPVNPIFDYEGKSYNPMSFAKEVLKLDMNAYIGFTSFTHHNFYEPMVVEVPDNFSDGVYTNLPLDELMKVLDEAIAEGFSVEWDGDVSEVGFARRKGYAVFNNDTNAIKNLPDLPSEGEVSQELRQALFDSYETTDDHLMHITGKTQTEDGRVFYVVKNSWGKKAGIEGHVLMSDAYMRMKTVSLYVHKSAVPRSILDKLED